MGTAVGCRDGTGDGLIVGTFDTQKDDGEEDGVAKVRVQLSGFGQGIKSYKFWDGHCFSLEWFHYLAAT